MPCVASPRLLGLTALLSALALGVMPSSAQADRPYTVRPGDTLAAIARRNHISVADLSAANRLASSGRLRPGQRLTVPPRGVVYIRAGDTLSGLARRHHVSVRALARANRLGTRTHLRVGRRLVLPGQPPAEERARAERRWGRARHPGVVTLVRARDRRRERIRLTGPSGRVRRSALDRMRAMLRSRRTGRTRRPNRRLVAMLAQVSDHFGGRTLYVISGYRPAGGYTRETSRHTAGRAIDLRVQGVPNTVLRDFCLTLPGAGVGYYPNSTFVHLDAREHSAHWVDRSRPGERPDYTPGPATAPSGGEAPNAEAPELQRPDAGAAPERATGGAHEPPAAAAPPDQG